METQQTQQNQIIEVLDNKNLTKPISNVNAQKKELLHYIDWQELKERLNNIDKPKVKILLTTLAYTGLRVSEVINIKKKDINFKDGYMEVLHLKSRKYQRRIIPIREELKNLLFYVTSNLNLEDKLFPYTRQYVFQLTKKYFFTHPHTFRHSFAVHFLKSSKDPMSLQLLKDLLGHSNINVTMEYLKIVPTQIKKALDNLEM